MGQAREPFERIHPDMLHMFDRAKHVSRDQPSKDLWVWGHNELAVSFHVTQLPYMCQSRHVNCVSHMDFLWNTPFYLGSGCEARLSKTTKTTFVLRLSQVGKLNSAKGTYRSDLTGSSCAV